MSRFDLYKISGGEGYLLDLQTDLLDLQTTRIVAPVMPQSTAEKTIKSMHPVVEINGEPHVVVTHLMGAVSKAALRVPVANLSDQADEFTRALDLLFQGY